MPSRLVRRRPLFERMKAYLNPLDILLWISEELDTSDWSQWQKAWATPVGIALNFVFLIARANCGPSKRKGDSVFGDNIQSIGWLNWLVRIYCPFGFLILIYDRQPLSPIFWLSYLSQMRRTHSGESVIIDCLRMLWTPLLARPLLTAFELIHHQCHRRPSGFYPPCLLGRQQSLDHIQISRETSGNLPYGTLHPYP